MQTKEATVLVSSLLKHSGNHKQDGHFKRVAASTIMSIVYDHPTIMSDHDHAVEGIEKFNDRFAETVAMGSYYVDIFPLLKYIPARSWFCFRSLTESAYWSSKLDLPNGSARGYKHSRRPPRCFSVFSIVLRKTLYVLISSASYGAQFD